MALSPTCSVASSLCSPFPLSDLVRTFIFVLLPFYYARRLLGMPRFTRNVPARLPLRVAISAGRRDGQRCAKPARRFIAGVLQRRGGRYPAWRRPGTSSLAPREQHGEKCPVPCCGTGGEETRPTQHANTYVITERGTHERTQHSHPYPIWDSRGKGVFWCLGGAERGEETSHTRHSHH